MGAIRFGKLLFKEFGDDDVSGLAAELAYRFFFALFPFVIFLAALGGFVADAFSIENPTEEVLDAFGGTLPADAESLLRKQLDEVVTERNPSLLTIGIIGAVWAAAGGVQAMMKATNRAYDVPETRPLWKRYLMAIGTVLFAGAFIIAAFVVMVGVQIYGKEIAELFGAGRGFEITLAVLRWPVVAGLIVVAMALVYWLIPNIELPFKWVSPGALAFTVAWVLASFLFSLYVSNFASYNATYGALGGVVVLLLFFYLSSLVMLVGAEINAAIEKLHEPASGLEKRRQAVIDLAATQARARSPYRPSPATPAPPAGESLGRAVQTSRTGSALGAAVAALTAWRLVRRLAAQGLEPSPAKPSTSPTTQTGVPQ